MFIAFSNAFITKTLWWFIVSQAQSANAWKNLQGNINATNTNKYFYIPNLSMSLIILDI